MSEGILQVKFLKLNRLFRIAVKIKAFRTHIYARNTCEIEIRIEPFLTLIKLVCFRLFRPFPLTNSKSYEEPFINLRLAARV